MKVELVGSTEKIRDPHLAKRWVQNHARVCYSEKTWRYLLDEEFDKGLVGSLIKRGHHSPFDHFALNFNIEGAGKALAMVLNNQGVYTTSEKSARYTVMSDVDDIQRGLYNKWNAWFQEEISSRFPESDFSKLYYRRKAGDKTTAEKLSQENARYMTSVFTPTKMTHTVSWRQMNILYHWFGDFIEENIDASGSFKAVLASQMRLFVDSPDIKKWVIDESQMRMKGGIPLRFFRDGPVEDHFGEDVYSYNEMGSFAYMAQSHRHRLDAHDVYGGFGLGDDNVFYVPKLVEVAKKGGEWLRDLRKVASYDFPQAQLLNISHRGLRENVVAKSIERQCGLAQLEIAGRHNLFLKRYAESVPAMKAQVNPACKIGNGCGKGGCIFGADNYLERLI